MNALIKARGWTSHKPVVLESKGRLTNGTMGRVRDKNGAGNVTLNTVDDLAQFFGKTPSELLAPDMLEHSTSARDTQPDMSFREAADDLAKNVQDPYKRDLYLTFLRGVDELMKERERIAKSIADITER